MPNSYTLPVEYPTLADAAAGTPLRARLFDNIGNVQNAGYAHGLRGGMAQSWPAGLATTGGAGYSKALEWRVPLWPGVNDLQIGMRHTASVGGYGFRKQGDAAPAVTMFGAGDSLAMLWNMQAYSAETYDASGSATSDYIDLEMLLNSMAGLYRVSVGHGITSVATSQYNDGFEGWGTIAQADAGAAALFHQGVDNLSVQAEIKTCWSAWSAPSSNVSGYTFTPPLFSMPVWCPGRVRDSRVVRVWIKLARIAPAASGRVDIRLGTPTPESTNHRFGRIMDSLSTADAAGEWLSSTFEIPRGFEIMPGLPGGYVNIDTANNLVDAAIQSISVWMEPAS